MRKLTILFVVITIIATSFLCIRSCTSGQKESQYKQQYLDLELKYKALESENKKQIQEIEKLTDKYHVARKLYNDKKVNLPEIKVKYLKGDTIMVPVVTFIEIEKQQERCDSLLNQCDSLIVLNKAATATKDILLSIAKEENVLKDSEIAGQKKTIAKLTKKRKIAKIIPWITGAVGFIGAALILQ